MSKTLRGFTAIAPFEGSLPIDGDYLKQAELIARTGMNRQIEALDPDKRERVSTACGLIGLSDEATTHILSTTCDLICFEQVGRHLMLTKAQRFDALADVRDLAAALDDALEALPIEEKIAMYNASREVRERGDHDQISLELVYEVAIPVVALSAQKLLDARNADEGAGGRRGVLDGYSRYVGSLANTFESEGLSIGRGGAFERLCSVVFEVAGVRATPEGAIRNMQKRNKP